MMYPRLKLARNLIRDDGVIFISIDDTEQANLRKICDDVFGEDNFVANIIWQKKYSPSNDAKWLSDNHDFILCYAKNKNVWRPNLLARSKEQNQRYTNPDNDPRGNWKPSDLSVKTYSEKNDYPITTLAGRIVRPPSGSCWRLSQGKLQEMIADNRIWFGIDGNNVPAIKRFLNEVKDGITPLTIWTYQEVGHNQTAAKEIKYIFKDSNSKIFDTPKPTSLIKKIIDIASEENGIILDFFAGSATTGHATWLKNLEYQGKRKFICVQIPEKVLGGEGNISDLSRERLRRSAKAIKDSNPLFNGDLGFKVFKLDTSNIKRWEAGFDTLEADLMDAVDYIKQDRSSEDLLFELLLKYGLDLAVPIETRTIAGQCVYSIGLGALVVCLDDDISMDVADGIGALKEELQPEIMRVVFKDSSFKDDVVKTNAIQTLKRFGIQDIKSL